MICINMKKRPVGHFTHMCYNVNCDPSNLLQLHVERRCEIFMRDNCFDQKSVFEPYNIRNNYQNKNHMFSHNFLGYQCFIKITIILQIMAVNHKLISK